MPSGAPANVLITSAGRRVELVRGFLGAARGRSRPIAVHALDIDSARSAACRVADARADSPRATDDAFVPFLERYCRDNDISLIVPTNDGELAVLAKLAPDWKGRGIHIAVGSAELVERTADKRLSASLFADIGLEYPTILDPDELSFPCFVKPVSGSGSVGARRLDAIEELTERERRNGSLVFMELVDPTFEEYTVDCYFDRDGRLRCAVPRQRLATRAGEVSKGRTTGGALHELVVDRMRRLRGAIGCITLQVFADRDASRAVAIEINPRFGGGYPLSLEAGADFPAWLLDEYVEGVVPDYGTWKAGLTMLRYDAHVIVDDV